MSFFVSCSIWTNGLSYSEPPDWCHMVSGDSEISVHWRTLLKSVSGIESLQYAIEGRDCGVVKISICTDISFTVYSKPEQLPNPGENLKYSCIIVHCGPTRKDRMSNQGDCFIQTVKPEKCALQRRASCYTNRVSTTHTPLNKSHDADVAPLECILTP